MDPGQMRHLIETLRELHPTVRESQVYDLIHAVKQIGEWLEYIHYDLGAVAEQLALLAKGKE
jgi:hypothetical protein